MADRRIFRVALGPSHRGEASSVFKLIRSLLPFGSRPKIKGFGQAIISLDQGSEAVAFAMYTGEFGFHGETHSAPALGVFTAKLGSKAWQDSLLSLEWLRHIKASQRKLHVHFALRLLGRWAKAKNARKNPVVLSRAIIALCTHGSELAARSDELSQVEFFALVSNQIAALNRLKVRDPQEALLQAAAQLYACTAFRGLESLRKPACDTLHSNIDQVIASDGVPHSGNPQDMIDLMSLMLPLQAAMKLDRQVFPSAAANALHRMFPALAMFTLEDGGFVSLFGDEPQSERISSLQAFDDSKAKALKMAHQSGFARFDAVKTHLVIDTKRNFAFECSIGLFRLFKSRCGNMNQEAQAQLHETQQGLALQVSEGSSRQRIYFLSGDGSDLRVEDRFQSPIEINLHLAPQIKIMARREGGIMLVVPDHTVWTLSLRGGEAHVDANGTILKITSTAANQMNWALKKQAKSAKPSNRKRTDEPDLLG